MKIANCVLLLNKLLHLSECRFTHENLAYILRHRDSAASTQSWHINNKYLISSQRKKLFNKYPRLHTIGTYIAVVNGKKITMKVHFQIVIR